MSSNTEGVSGDSRPDSHSDRGSSQAEGEITLSNTVEHEFTMVPASEAIRDDEQTASETIPEFDQLPHPGQAHGLPKTEDNQHASTDSGKITEKPRTERPVTTTPGTIYEMHRFSVYLTAAKFYIVGGDLTDDRFRVLKIERMAHDGELNLTEDGAVYTKDQMNQLLSTIDDGNKSTGGLKMKCSAWGLLGFIRFTGPYYMLLITKRSQVAVIGGHYIYQVDGTELVSLAKPSTSRFRSDRHPEEARFLTILNNLDLTRSFYFSHSYNVTRTLQRNIIHARQNVQAAAPGSRKHDLNDMVVWNHYLLEPALKLLKSTLDWCLPIVHGHVDQSTLYVHGRSIHITIIARRSRFFAGARFLKRGTNDLGYVANDVETEQIVSDMLTTSFHAPGAKLYANWNYTSYVQHRGSIPVYWTQDTSGVSPKPPIEINLIDPFYSAAALHFDNLFERYGTPVYVLNLVKARERMPRESKLLHEYTNAINYLNQFLPEKKRIIYKAWDMSRASRSRDQDVIGTLEAIAEDVLSVTGFFRNGDDCNVKPTLQRGVARTNCIDCLDRTNAAQFVIGKRALGHQLHALGVISEPVLEYDTDSVNLFTHMFHDHGDTLAVQYGGSHLVNTMETYRKINTWTSHSRDMVESFKRYYHNSFLDGQRQEAYNLFLGNYIFTRGQPMLWDLSTDYYLHHSDPRKWATKKRRSYIDWYTPEFLKDAEMPPVPEQPKDATDDTTGPLEDYWLEYYRPLALSSFSKLFVLRMNSTLKYTPFKHDQEGAVDPSSFRVRSSGLQDSPRRSRNRRGTSSNELCGYKSDDTSSETSRAVRSETMTSSQWSLPPHADGRPAEFDSAPVEKAPAPAPAPGQRTLEQFVHDSLNPVVTDAEAAEYQRYLDHPHNLSLVDTSDGPPADAHLDLWQYLNGVHLDTTWIGTTPDYSALESGLGSSSAGAAGAGISAAAADEMLSSSNLPCSAEDMAVFREYLTVSDNPLSVTEADYSKKRYRAYQQWLKGKSLFKQQRVET
ncbi:MAG: phosphatidylinositol-3,5-bisphosphate 5-phosphatase [Lichina confinis]|nr:MAG: phosphatidylinositol-3,5-bisphosphate 5-phosphatase [Lichina confinis]